MMKIAVGSDHRGTEVIRHIADSLESAGHQVVRIAIPQTKTCDYPDHAFLVANAVSQGDAQVGILVCGSGIGMSIAANKVNGVRAALVHDDIGAEMSRLHNNANVLCLSADMLGVMMIDLIVEKWIATEFEGGRHQRRVDKITAIEQRQNSANVSS